MVFHNHYLFFFFLYLASNFLLTNCCMSEVFPWSQIPKAHTKMWKNEHAPGNMAVLVNAPTTGLRTFEDVLDAGKS